VNAFVLVMIVLVGGLFVFVLLLGIFYPGSGADQVGWHPTRSPELEHQNEIDDLAQMQEAVNARRRARGAAEITEAGIRAEVAADLRAQVVRGDDALVEQDIAEMLALKNSRRELKGLPPLTREQLERQILGDSPQ
jgi:hypothetical protein